MVNGLEISTIFGTVSLLIIEKKVIFMCGIYSTYIYTYTPYCTCQNKGDIAVRRGFSLIGSGVENQI